MSITALPSALSCVLWRVDLDAAPAPDAVRGLSTEESNRARRFVFARDRSRYLAAHVALRQTLAGPARRHAAQLCFTAGRFGKPALAVATGLHFNLSHSQGVGLIALSEQAEIGVDVELVRPMIDAGALAADYFDAAERDALAAIEPGPSRDLAFFRCWTRKEACLKAAGVGLGLDTRSFHVGLEPDTRNVTMPLDDGPLQVALVSTHDGQGAVAALAKVLTMRRDAEPECEVFA
ncbi:4'-phosphopantetheinyl transferase superfamily protein [Variovorax sp. J22G21]|uniref:4'-phosphopantetheinyl transferase family protein n=1 Tax=Variovorax fucosicus TaxID=3053517 RepID=UPI0025758161|nr:MULTISPECIES: 4'-phosphopantetheinyl transferase superfamily protein [unclassified Variovorax]MDM0038347.1 4'-phosphopantetheinyl transferase superfamily protein [Variovorax sp. J22R193]MDM0055984.1 4'-phosphopantetheinyl transferase superfamily protein [Variovorax sp. J22G47]MDM0063123.1 4'-phosphopantetheinyl transferase superfamily protein [Variovorax sp. J22G21]